MKKTDLKFYVGKRKKSSGIQRAELRFVQNDPVVTGLKKSGQ